MALASGVGCALFVCIARERPFGSLWGVLAFLDMVVWIGNGTRIQIPTRSVNYRNEYYLTKKKKNKPFHSTKPANLPSPSLT